MTSWFVQQDATVKAAVIGAIATIIAALIALVANILKLIIDWRSSRKKNNESQKSAINITQSTTGNNNTFIGVQNNKGDKHE